MEELDKEIEEKKPVKPKTDKIMTDAIGQAVERDIKSLGIEDKMLRRNFSIQLVIGRGSPTEQVMHLDNLANEIVNHVG